MEGQSIIDNFIDSALEAELLEITLIDDRMELNPEEYEELCEQLKNIESDIQSEELLERKKELKRKGLISC